MGLHNCGIDGILLGDWRHAQSFHVGFSYRPTLDASLQHGASKHRNYTQRISNVASCGARASAQRFVLFSASECVRGIVLALDRARAGAFVFLSCGGPPDIHSAKYFSRKDI